MFGLEVVTPYRREIAHLFGGNITEGILGDEWLIARRYGFDSADDAYQWAESFCFEASTQVDMYAAQGVSYITFVEDDGVYWDADIENAEEEPELPCPYCGAEENEYCGEQYEDDGTYLGSEYKCLDCGSGWCDGMWNELHN